MFANFTEAMLELFVTSLWETIVMVGISGVVGALLGIPLGVFLRLTDHGGVLENGPVNKLVGWVVNAVRSTPFIILLVAIIPLTRFVTGSSIGTAAAVVPLTIAAAPFVARLVEAALREVDHGLVEAAQAMGADMAYIGSPFIATNEARASDAYKQAIVDAQANDIVYSNYFTGIHGNYLKSSIVAAGMDPERWAGVMGE